MCKSICMEDWTHIFREIPKDPLGAYTPENKKFKETREVSDQIDEKAHKKATDRRFQKLKHQISYLYIELDELQENLDHARKIFYDKMVEYCSRESLELPFKKREEDKNHDDNSKQIKEIYREIVKLTHPDKNKELPEKENEHMTDLYHQASEGKETGSFQKIINVAMDLDINLQEINPEILNTIEVEIKNIYERIVDIKKDVMYIWFYAPKEIQKAMFEHITKKCKPILRKT